MLNKTFTNSFFVFIVLVTAFVLNGCKSVDKDYLIDVTQMQEKIADVDTSIIIFWTDWCTGKHNIENEYVSYLDYIQENSLNAQVFLIASDNQIKDEVISKYADMGFKSYSINAGNFVMMNRIKIRQFIRNVFPNENIKDFKTITYAIPVVLWVTKDGKVLNKDDLSKTYPFSDHLFNTKTIIVEE